ncbi:MAG: hypothetical protein ACT4PP_05110 [Sporichthyaceae bacterium]
MRNETARSGTRHPLEPALARANERGPAPEELDGLIPFDLTEAEAAARVRRWVRRSWLAPAGYRRAVIGSPSAVYLPCYTFSARTDSHYTGTTQKFHRKGSNATTKTKRKSGRLQRTFDDLPVCSVPALEVSNLRRLEPWPAHRLTSVQAMESSRALAPQLGLAAAAPAGRDRLDEEIRREINDELGGDRRSIDSLQTNRTEESYRHLLLPVVVVPVTHRLFTQYVLVNAASGKVGGQRPPGHRRLILFVAALWLLFALVGVALPDDCNPRCPQEPQGAPAGPAAEFIVHRPGA